MLCTAAAAAVLCCAVLCCAVLCCAVLCCAVLCCRCTVCLGHIAVCRSTCEKAMTEQCIHWILPNVCTPVDTAAALALFDSGGQAAGQCSETHLYSTARPLSCAIIWLAEDLHTHAQQQE
jgi:hypothetical protein